MKIRPIITAILFGFIAVLLITPLPLFAQADAPAVADAETMTNTNTIQIIAADPQAVRALLEEPAVIPGGYGGYAAVVFWTMIFGALGGLVFELLLLRGYVALPHRYKPGRVPDNDIFLLDGFTKPRSAVDFGVFARMFVGAMAALAILLVVSPAARMQLIAAAVIAGSAGASIFDTLRARLTASLAVADAADVRNKSEQLEARLDEMAELIAQLQAQSRHTPSVPDGETVHEFAEADEADLGAPDASRLAVVDPATLDQLSILLGEAKGIRASMARHRLPSPPDPGSQEE